MFFDGTGRFNGDKAKYISWVKGSWIFLSLLSEQLQKNTNVFPNYNIDLNGVSLSVTAFIGYCVFFGKNEFLCMHQCCCHRSEGASLITLWCL